MKILRQLLVLLMLVPSTVATSTMSGETLNGLRKVDGAIEQFRLEHKRIPSETEGLQAVKTYLRKGELFDAWGHAFVYRLASTNSDGYIIYSVGEDGSSATAGNDSDDINLWDREEKWRKHYAPNSARKNGGVISAGLALLALFSIGVWHRWKFVSGGR